MHESTAWDVWLDEGRLEGDLRTSHRLLLRQARKRFGPADSATESALTSIKDLERLERMAEAVLTVRDEGAGFDPGTLPDPTDPANLGRSCGRGLFLIRSFMDEVRHNAAGNEITLVKRRTAESPPPLAPSGERGRG